MTIKCTSTLLLLMLVNASSLYATDPDIEVGEQAIKLSDWQWQYRVLIINIEDLQSTDDLLDALSDNSQMIKERKLKVLLLKGLELVEAPTTGDALIERTSLNAKAIQQGLAGKTSVLIGLDGGLKSFYDWPTANQSINLRQVFADIDGMPMRQQQLRRNQR
ncbi:DUF4174 domain-containing protein [Glaciecola sp. SC05]|uniref:DUF4174 domain-containing protein n=1 Tax=Glaciecola sp. SC05 TaxID=1987355 RepID=UPI0035298933